VGETREGGVLEAVIGETVEEALVVAGVFEDGLAINSEISDVVDLAGGKREVTDGHRAVI
jgi:hypothetical protein